jgi:hypothetical protein
VSGQICKQSFPKANDNLDESVGIRYAGLAANHQFESFNGTESGTELLKTAWRKRG